jgi:predicted transposase YdaD
MKQNSTLTIEMVLEEAGIAAKYEARGEAKGEEKARTEIARNLLDMGWTIEQTAKTSCISLEKVQSLYAAMHGNEN